VLLRQSLRDSADIETPSHSARLVGRPVEQFDAERELAVILRSSTQHMNKLPGPGLTFVEHWKGQRGSVREHAKSGHCHANFKLIHYRCHLFINLTVP
jgi:hypothetical protein